MTDSLGRWIAVHFVSRFAGLSSLLVVAAFILLKVKREPATISTTNCLGLAFSVFTLITATNAGAVFLLTSPPALDLLAKDSLALERCRNGSRRLYAGRQRDSRSFS